MLSNCCDAPAWNETDLCSACMEHADFYDEDEPEDNLSKYMAKSEMEKILMELAVIAWYDEYNQEGNTGFYREIMKLRSRLHGAMIVAGCLGNRELRDELEFLYDLTEQMWRYDV